MPSATSPPWARHLPPGVDPSSVDLLAARSLPAAWASRAAARPDRVVLVAGDARVRAADLAERSAAVAARYAAAGLAPGDRIVMSVGTSIDLVVAHVAALRLGLVVVPVNGAYREREVAVVVGDARPRAAVVDDPERGVWIERAADGPVVVVGPEVDLPGGPRPALDAAGPDDLAMLCYTSGTTGTPKGAMLTHGNLLASAEAVRLAWRWTADDVLVLALPLFHVHGLGVGLHGSLLAGGTAVLLPRFDVDGVLDAAHEHGGTMFFGVPAMYQRFAGSERVGELASLRLCVSGSAPLPAELCERLRADAGVSVLERYGMTETMMNVSNPYDGERRPGTVGFPLPRVEVRLDGAGGDAPGRPGEILLRGPNVFAGYWGRPEATRDAFTDGWFRSGDIGEYDADGYLAIVGRAKELIISGGFNVYPREVEDVLLSHPAVAEVAVVGVPSAEWGEVVTAFVVAAEPATETQLLDYARDELAPYKRPRAVHFVDALPRNALGKVLRDQLHAP